MNQENILVVEDDPAVRETMIKIILSLGYNCQEAVDGDQALDLILNNNFDIIICDIKLPKMDGLTLLSRVQEKKPESNFIIITGYYKDYSYDKVILAGAQDFIKKPFSIAEFNKKLTRILFERKLDQENKRLQEEQAATTTRLSTLVEVAADLSSELNFDRLLPLIIGKVTEIMAAERASLYIIDHEKQELWTKVAEGIEQIRLPIGKGISGSVAVSGKMLNVADAWDLPNFDREFDKKHKFRTRSVLCTPIKNHTGKMIGVLQIINKKNNNRFDSNDEVLIKALTSQVGIALENSLLHEELQLSFDSSIRTLSAVVDAKHRFTAGHSERVTEYSLMIAKEMDMSEQEIKILKFAAILHDIGKIGVPDSVLLKNGPFSSDERAEMNKHSEKTKVILNTFHFPKELEKVPEIAAHHHEKVDGTGYPDGLKGDKMPLGAKIIAVADVFDALTSKRDYPKYDSGNTFTKDPMPILKAVTILENDSGTHFDPEVVAAFLRCMPKALLKYRGSHFSPEYVDEAIHSSNPELLPDD